MPAGRPTNYNDELAAEICGRIARGESVRSITRDEQMPGLSTIYLWLNKHPKFVEQYTRAKEDSADALADDILHIADNDGDVQRDRLRVDARKWIASKLKPKKYGERLTHSGDEDNPIKHVGEIRIRAVDADDRPSSEG